MTQGAPAAAAPRMPRRWLISAWALFTALAVMWMGYWKYLETRARSAVQDIIAAQTDSGAEMQIERITSHGFPRLMRLELAGVRYAPKDRAWRATAPSIDVHLNPGNPRQTMLVLGAPVDVRYANGAQRTFAADDARLSLHFGARERIERTGFEATNASWTDAATHTPLLSAAHVVANARPDPRTSGAYQLALESTTLRLRGPVHPVEGLGAVVRTLRAAISVTQADALVAEPSGDPFERWRAAQGEAHVEGVQIAWGEGDFTGDGVMRFDAQRRLNGRMHVAFREPARTLAAIARSPGLPENARSALLGLAAANALMGEDVESTLDFRDGWLTAGSVRVRDLPPVY